MREDFNNDYDKSFQSKSDESQKSLGEDYNNHNRKSRKREKKTNSSSNFRFLIIGFILGILFISGFFYYNGYSIIIINSVSQT